MKKIEAKLLPHQFPFVSDLEHPYVGFVGGFGSGKTYACCVKAIYLSVLNQGHVGLIVSPQHKNNKRTVVPELIKLLTKFGIQYDFRWTPTPTFYLHLRGGTTTILLDSAENAESFVGLNLAWAGVDEADTLSHDRMETVWHILLSRLRAIGAKHKQLYITTTPEGFKWTYEYFEKDLIQNPEKAKNRAIYRGDTRMNPYLDPEYVEGLLENYPVHKRRAYIKGEFVNMTGSTVYERFDRNDNRTEMTIEDLRIDSILHIGVDFNIGYTCGIVSAIKNNIVYVIDEIVEMRDTDQLIAEIKRRYHKFPYKFIYPDSSGKAEKTNSSKTDIYKLQAAFGKARVLFHTKNPNVTDRVNSVNDMFYNDFKQLRRCFVNIDTCPTLTGSLEKQAYDKNGKPDKSNNIDHPVDGLGYFIWFRFPLVSRGKIKVR